MTSISVYMPKNYMFNHFFRFKNWPLYREQKALPTFTHLKNTCKLRYFLYIVLSNIFNLQNCVN